MSAREEIRAEAFREAAAAIVAENDRMLWATKPGRHWAADLVIRMAETAAGVAELGALPMPAGPVDHSSWEDPHDSPLHSPRRIPHDLEWPETGGAV